MAQLEIRDLCKSFGEVHAVDHVSLSIETGEMLCLLGPSGCGKTTLLRILSGFLPPDQGQVLMDGIDVTALPPENRPTSLVFQNYALFPHLNVFENVAFGLKLKKLPSRQIRDKVMENLKLVGMEGMESRAITQLSGGQQQRVALARALVMEPKMLLLDEPLSNLDAKLRVETRQQIRRLQQRLGITAVFVTHDQEEAMSMGDKIAILKEGQLQQIDDPMTLYRNPANSFVAGFLGTPAMNFIPGRIDKGVLYLGGTEIADMEVPDKEGGCTLGIRPEDILISDKEVPNALAGKIESIELLGDHALIYVRWDDRTICCRCGVREDLQAGQTVYLEINRKRAKLFDTENGSVL